MAISAGTARAQALPTAQRLGDLQIGGGFSIASADYTPNKIKGGTFYTSFDFLKHFGVELDLHQVNDSGNQLYERTYEAGGRYYRSRGRLTPYVRAMYGRGVLNYPNNYANVAYNMVVGGGGVELEVHKRIKVRVDGEYQDWSSGPGIQHGLTPVMVTVGVAYHFHPGRLYIPN
jgi:hypothetical protein